MRPGHWDPSPGLNCSSEPPPKSPISLPLTIQAEARVKVRGGGGQKAREAARAAAEAKAKVRAEAEAKALRLAVHPLPAAGLHRAPQPGCHGHCQPADGAKSGIRNLHPFDIGSSDFGGGSSGVPHGRSRKGCRFQIPDFSADTPASA